MKNTIYLIITLFFLAALTSCNSLMEHIRTAREQGKEQNESQYRVIFNDEDAESKPVTLQKGGKQKPKQPVQKSEDIAYFEKKWKIPLNGNEDLVLLNEIDSWLGTPYKYGGNTKEGTDCSGMVLTIWKNLYQIDLKRSSYELWQQSTTVNKEQLQFGDFVFFRINRNQISHVGIYIANEYFVHSSSSRGVVIDHLEAKYFADRFATGGRIKK